MDFGVTNKFYRVDELPIMDSENDEDELYVHLFIFNYINIFYYYVKANVIYVIL